MPVSAPRSENLAEGNEVVISAGPCVVTSVLVTETGGSVGATVALRGESDMVNLMTISVGAGQTVVWSGEGVAAGGGLVVGCLAGDVVVMVAYR